MKIAGMLFRTYRQEGKRPVVPAPEKGLAGPVFDRKNSEKKGFNIRFCSSLAHISRLQQFRTAAGAIRQCCYVFKRGTRN